MIGKRLRKLRIAKGLTQVQVAAPEYTHAYLSSIESGHRTPSRRALECFASKLEVDVEELITGRPPDLEARLVLRLQEARVALSAGRFEDADRTFRSVEKEAKRYGLPRIHASAEEGRGLWLERKGKPEEALHHFQRAEELVRSEPPIAGVDAIAGKARCFEALGDVRYAIHILESLLDALKREGLEDPDALARVHSSLVYAYLEAGLFERAASSAAELDHLAPRLTDPSRVAQMHMNVARHHLMEGRVEDAEHSLARAQDAYRQLDWKTEAGGAHLAKGYVLSREGNTTQAREQLEQALEIFEETGNQKDLTRALNELARLERVAGQTQRAAALLERSIGLLADADTPILAWAHRELGLTFSQGEPAKAEKHLGIAIELYERSEQTVDLALSYGALGDLVSISQPEAACEAYRTGIHALEGVL